MPAAHPSPLVTVHDGHAHTHTHTHTHTLSFLAAARGDRMRCLGRTEFGQSSSLADAYALHGIDTAAIADAALSMLGR